jgi:VanZ family protein
MQTFLDLDKVRLLSKWMFVLLIVVISAIAFLPNYDKLPEVVSISGVINHFVAFLVLAFFLNNGYKLSVKNAFLLLFTYGFFIEAVQYFLPNRCFELLDLVVDMNGVGAFYILKSVLARKRGSVSG